MDIWSLGCVLDVVCTWLVKNWTYVEEYSERRRIEFKKTGRSKEEDDCFHNGKDELLNCVRQNHYELAQDVRQSDYITKKVLKMIKGDMLRSSGARQDAKYLCHEVEKMIGEAEAKLHKTTRGFKSFETDPGNGLGLFSEPALEPPEPPGNTPPLNYNPPRPPLSQSGTIFQPPFVHGGSPISNGHPHFNPQGQTRYEYPTYGQTYPVEDDTANSWEPTLPGTRRVSASPHRHPSHYSHREPRSHVQLQGEAEESIYNPLVGATRGAHRISNHENQNLPIPGSSPTTPERNLRAPHEDLRMQRDSAHEPAQGSLQRQKPLPVWEVEDALKWKRVKKDPKNYERIRIPDDNHDLEKLKGRDHVRVLLSTSFIC